MSKTILGLDLGTNSIGWALVNPDEQKIIGLGSRIIPMSQDILGDFNKGNSISQTANRTALRSVRRLRERHLLRRERMHRILQLLGFLPEHFASYIDKHGKFIDDVEVKLPYSHFDSALKKWNFIFKEVYEEMLSDFRTHQPELFKLKANGEETKIPYDWTIYYLRKKALTQKIEKDELAWLLLHFLQKRGYYQLRGEDEDTKENKIEQYYSLKVTDVIEADKSKRESEIWYHIHLENGLVYKRSSKIPLFDWKGKTKEFIITTELEEDGTIKKDKDGNERRSFRSPKDDDWGLIKKKTESDLESYLKNAEHNTLGTYIYDHLLRNPNLKIKGKFIRTIERKFYKSELKKILQFQIPLHKEFNEENYALCIEALYESNHDFRNSIKNNNFEYLFIDNIIFYQRPLKSKKSEISDCSLEYRIYKKDGIEHVQKMKCIAKSHPLFQEFRLWQWMQNLKIYQKEKIENGKLLTDVDVTTEFIKNIDDFTSLFDFLNAKKEVKQDDILKFLLKPLYPKIKSKELSILTDKYRWNYSEDKSFPCNETRFNIISRLAKVDGINESFLTKEREIELWHILYSVTDKIETEKALATFAKKYEISEGTFVENFRKYPLIKSEYGAFSVKAIKKLLQLMRIGKYWDGTKIDPSINARIQKIITGEYDEKIKNRVRDKTMQLTQLEHFQGLPLWLASYVIYDRHAEASDTSKWETPADLDYYLQMFKQHSLRNPIVEQVLVETLRVVNDIWKHPAYGNSQMNYFSEIHIELGREMKNNAEERKKLNDNNLKNENTNLRIRAILTELKSKGIQEVMPYSPHQQEALKIYEEGVMLSGIDIPDDILKISKSAAPTSSEIEKYTLWLEQKYLSPYTGATIPLSKLFTSAYEIEHIIPQSIYFDDSLKNKVICESEVNKLKDNQLGYEFITKHGGEIVTLSGGRQLKVLTKSEYEEHIKTYYAKNKGKAQYLLLEDLPEKMIERQLNDTRYISKMVKNLLSHIVREKDEDATTSKNIITCTGAITGVLKQDWGLNDVWNDLMLPRFERLNALTNSTEFTTYNERYQKFLPTVPDHLRKGFQLKRIDHRHHAMDALIIACTTRNHINYLNNLSALSKDGSKEDKQKKRYDLKVQLCLKTTPDSKGNYKWQFKKPWDTFTQDAHEKLEHTIISFKQNLRVLNSTVNYYQKIEHGKKVFVKQIQGENWAIRKPLHKGSVYGMVQLPMQKLEKGKFFTAMRSEINTSITEKDIQKITDSGIQKILLAHLENYKGQVDEKGKEVPAHELAFSPEGIEEMNKNILALNQGVPHKPIYKARFYEAGSRFQVGYRGNKKDKYVEAEKGTNLYFAIYENNESKERSYATIPLHEVIERLKQKLSPVPEKAGCRLVFHLSPNDVIYIPNEDEVDKDDHLLNLQSIKKNNRLIKIVSFTGNRLYGTPISVANSIYDKFEFSQLNKVEQYFDVSIKKNCWKIHLDKLGTIRKIQK